MGLDFLSVFNKYIMLNRGGGVREEKPAVVRSGLVDLGV